MAFGLVSMGLILVSFGIIVNTSYRTSLLQEKNIIASDYLGSQSKIFLEEGKRVLDFYDVYLRNHEKELAENDFMDTPHFQSFHTELLQVFQNYANQQIVKACSGFGTPNGSLFLGCDGYIDYTNSSLKDNPCCNYTETNQPSPMYRIYLNDSFHIPPKDEWISYGSPYDFRMLDQGWWQIGSKTEPNKTYTTAHFITTHNDVSSTITKKWYDSEGNFRFLLGKWFLLSNFQIFLDGLNNVILERTIWMVDKQNNALIATNVGANIVTQFGNSTVTRKNERISPKNSENLEIAEVSQFIESKYSWSHLQSISTLEPITTSLGIKLISIETIDVAGFEIAIVMSVSFTYIYSSVFILIGISLLFGSVVVVSFTFCTIFLLMRMISPLTNLTEEMEKVRTMDLDAISITLSRLFEINRMQSSFLFTVEKLKEFKSFIPARIFQKERESSLSSLIKKRKLFSRSSGRKSNKSTSRTLVSRCSFYSYASSVSSGIEERDVNSFCIGIVDSVQSLLCIFFTIEDDFLKRNQAEVLDFISSCFDKVTSLSESFGRLMEYNIERIVMLFESPETLCNVSIKLRKFFSKMEVVNKSRINVRIILHKNSIFTGNVGSDALKNSVICGSEMKQIGFFNEVVTETHNYKKDNSYDIILTGEINKDLDENFLRYPIDFVKGLNGKRYTLFYLEKIEKLKDDEWMYFLNQKKSMERHNKLHIAFEMILSNNLKDAIEKINEFSSKYGTNQCYERIKCTLIKMEEKGYSLDQVSEEIEKGSILVNPKSKPKNLFE